MRIKCGFSLIEMVVVLIIIAIVVAFALPNYNASNERAMALNAQNNLLAIYTAQLNYFNNQQKFWLTDPSIDPSDPGPPPYVSKLTQSINTGLSLNIQDDGMYLYHCDTDSGSVSCMAERNNTNNDPSFKLKLNLPIVVHPTLPICPNSAPNCVTVNPACVSPSNWCP